MRLHCDLWRRVRRLAVIGLLNAVIDALKVLVNWISLLLIFGFEFCGHDIHVSIDQMLEEIVVRHSEESSVLIIQLLEVHVFDGVDDLILDCPVRCFHIFVYSPSSVVLTLELVLVGLGRVWCYGGLYYQVR